MIHFEQLIEKKNNYRHHAFLLISKQFEHSEITSAEFQSFVQEFCQIKLHNDHVTSAFEMAQYHPDIFIADRQKKTLTISDLEKINELSLYPPTKGSKRLFVIESCQRMNMHAANALLKILEEPSSSALFLMTCPHISSVLPTIASRAQKIFISFSDSKKTNITSLFSENDVNWIREQILKFNLAAYRSFLSLSETKPRSISPSYLKEVIEYSERLSKEYKSNDLCDLIVTLISTQLKENTEFLQPAKIVLSTISQWKEAMPFNPSAQFWLTRIFLGFN